MLKYSVGSWTGGLRSQAAQQNSTSCTNLLQSLTNYENCSNDFKPNFPARNLSGSQSFHTNFSSSNNDFIPFQRDVNNQSSLQRCLKRPNIGNIAQNFKQKLNKTCDRFVESTSRLTTEQCSGLFRNRRHSITFADNCLDATTAQETSKQIDSNRPKASNSNSNSNNSKMISKNTSKLPPPSVMYKQQQRNYSNSDPRESTKILGNVTKKILVAPRYASLERSTLLHNISNATGKLGGIITNGTIMNKTLPKRTLPETNSAPANGKRSSMNGNIRMTTKKPNLICLPSPVKSVPASNPSKIVFVVPASAQQMFANSGPMNGYANSENISVAASCTELPPPPPPAPTPVASTSAANSLRCTLSYSQTTTPPSIGSGPSNCQNSLQQTNGSMLIQQPSNSININGTPTPFVGYIVPASSVIELPQNFPHHHQHHQQQQKQQQQKQQQKQGSGCQEFQSTSSNRLRQSNGQIPKNNKSIVKIYSQNGTTSNFQTEEENCYSLSDVSSLQSDSSTIGQEINGKLNGKANGVGQQSLTRSKHSSATDMIVNNNGNLSLRRRIPVPPSPSTNSNSSNIPTHKQQQRSPQQSIKLRAPNGYVNGKENCSGLNNTNNQSTTITTISNYNSKAVEQNGVNKNIHNRPLSAPQPSMTSTIGFNLFPDSPTYLKNCGDATLRRGQSTTMRFKNNLSSIPSSSTTTTKTINRTSSPSKNVIIMSNHDYPNGKLLGNSLNGNDARNLQHLNQTRLLSNKTGDHVNGNNNNNSNSNSTKSDSYTQQQHQQKSLQQRQYLQKENATEFPAYSLPEEGQHRSKLMSPLVLANTESFVKQNLQNSINPTTIDRQEIILPLNSHLISKDQKSAKQQSNLTTNENPTLTNNNINNAQKISPHASIFNNNVASTSSLNSAGNSETSSTKSTNSPIPNGSFTTGTVVIRLTPELFQQSALCITGGADCAHPAIISKIAPKTNIPLNEGDQVLKINGQDIGRWTQSKLNSFLQTMRQNSTKELLFAIKPNVYRCGGLVDDDSSARALELCAFVLNETLHVDDAVPRSDKLAHSITLIKSMLEGNRLNAHFEQIYRKRPGATMDAAHLTDNLGKNRYRDVCPYDSTRVKLKNSPTGNYINANNINMEIKSSGIVNRYIATQGPLPHTTPDFWWMVWEQSSTTIVMLTTLVEKGRVKCHQYWPDSNKAFEFGSLSITTVSERTEPHCCYREFSIQHKVSREERRVTQMQYTAWPDHGVPENSRHFTKFVGEVRSARNGSIEPIVVHCSAGIGRTGVLIMMETAACMIEANEPVYPLDIMKTMRDQRAMLIQTIDQFAFVCESILRAYNERSVKPLAEYQRG